MTHSACRREASRRYMAAPHLPIAGLTRRLVSFGVSVCHLMSWKSLDHARLHNMNSMNYRSASSLDQHVQHAMHLTQWTESVNKATAVTSVPGPGNFGNVLSPEQKKSRTSVLVWMIGTQHCNVDSAVQFSWVWVRVTAITDSHPGLYKKVLSGKARDIFTSINMNNKLVMANLIISSIISVNLYF